MTHEIWAAVVGYEGFYEVSSMGSVRSLARVDALGRTWPAREMATPIDRTSAGYRYIKLSKHGRATKLNVHILVLEAFVGPRPSPAHEGCHGDGDRTNAALSNLRWGTTESNHADKWAHGTMKAGSKNHKAVFSEEVVGWIKESRQSSLSLAPMLGVSSSAIRAVRSGQNWGHLA